MATPSPTKTLPTSACYAPVKKRRHHFPIYVRTVFQVMANVFDDVQVSADDIFECPNRTYLAHRDMLLSAVRNLLAEAPAEHGDELVHQTIRALMRTQYNLETLDEFSAHNPLEPLTRVMP